MPVRMSRTTMSYMVSRKNFIAALLAGSLPFPVLAQEAAAPAASGAIVTDADIVVTARRREETQISAPVAVSAVGQAELTRRGITQLDNLVAAVPQLIISDAGASTQGGVVLIRGIGVGESNPFADQAVSFNVDGVQLSRANIRRLSEIDMAQVEVLKGPQALFFGKNSPAGIIVIRTADPGKSFEAGVNASYEFNGQEIRTDAFVSGPLSDNFGVRIAGFYSHLNGYFDNVATPSPTYGLSRSKLPQNQDYGGRITLKYDPGGRFDARLKLSYGNVDSSGPESSMQAIDCPLGYNQLSPTIANSCTGDKRSVIADPGPNIAAVSTGDFAAVPYVAQEQILSGLEMNYALSDTLKLTSVTGYYQNRTSFVSSATVADTTNTGFVFVSAQRFKANEFSQELRLASSFDGPINFMVGGYYQDADLRFQNFVVRNSLTPVVAVPKRPVHQDGKAYSAFGQLMWKITPELELSGGGRYSYEKKDYAVFDAAGNRLATASPGNSWDNFSPEATLAYRPNQNLTIYGAYKTGFLSGGFAVASGDLTRDRSYDQQLVRGFEAGVKGRMGHFWGSITAYRYVNTGLQVTSNIVDPVIGVDQRIVNAGKAINQGIEAELRYRNGPVDLHGAVAYNNGRYKQFVTTCYAGQSVALGCNLSPTTAGVYQNQDLSGQHMVRAPDWVLQGGGAYNFDLAGGDTLGLSADVNFSSGYFAAPSNKPASWQTGYATVDGGVTYTNARYGFTIGLLGRNLTNQYYYSRAIDSTFTGSGTGTTAVTPSDTIASISRGRQIMVRAGVRFR